MGDARDSASFDAALMEALLMAADPKSGPNPTARAARARRWLKTTAYRGDGVRAGWGGITVHLLTDESSRGDMRRRIVALAREGTSTHAIALEVRRSLKRVQNVIAEAKRKGALM